MTSHDGPYDAGTLTGSRPANYVPLSPLTFLERSASVYPEHYAVRNPWRARASPGRETYARCRRLASALVKRGVGNGDTVAVFAPNVPEPCTKRRSACGMAGAVVNTINIRLDAATVAFILAARRGEGAHR